MLGEQLLANGWAVRGTSRREEGVASIESAGLEAALADPERPDTLLELIGDVAVVYLLLGSARGEPEQLETIHGPRLESLLERLVDTPVRGVLYEGAGSVDGDLLATGAALVRAAGERWRIPFEILAADPAEPDPWLAQALAATERLLGEPLQ
jgi:uncharacterized protein YbjT (DUF2867 family)